MSKNKNSGTDISAVDKALAAAKARKAAKEGTVVAQVDPTPQLEGSPDTTPTGEAPVVDEAAAKAAVLATKEAEKAAKKAAKDATRALKKSERETQLAARKVEREAKRAAKLTEKGDKKAHMSKVEKAASKLPALSSEGTRILDEVTSNLGLDQANALAEHLKHFVRAKSTERALTAKLTVGQVVKIVSGGYPKFIGCTATVMRPQRIRCYVSVPGCDKEVYLFTSDVVPVSTDDAASIPAPATTEATGTEG